MSHIVGPLLPIEAFSSITSVLKDKKVHLLSPSGNIGNLLSWEGTKQFLYLIGTEFSTGDLPEDPSFDYLVYAGGIVGTFPGREKFNRRWIITDFLVQHDLHVVGLPLSHLGGEEPLPEKCTLFARDAVSQKRIPGSMIAPDLALFWKGTVKDRDPDGEKGIFITGNCPFKKNLGDPLSFCSSLEDYLDLSSRFEEVWTNRLMFAICGLLNKRKVVLLPDSSHKNKSFYNTWLRDLCEWYEPKILFG